MSRRRKRKKKPNYRWLQCLVLLLLIVVSIMKITDLVEKKTAPSLKVVEESPVLNVQLLTVNEYSRPGIERDQINGIVVHYTANPGNAEPGLF